MIDINYYLLNAKCISELYIAYTEDDILKSLRYKAPDNTIYDGIVKTEKDYKHNVIYSWSIDVDKDSSSPVKIISGYITRDYIEKIRRKRGDISFLSYNSATNKDPNTNSYSLDIPYGNNRFISLDFDAKYNLVIEKNDGCIIIKAKNSITGVFEFTHYIDKHLYYIIDDITHLETVYLNDQNIKYEFDRYDLSISNYLQYHKPIRVTNYDTNRQYEIKYDQFGIMKSMVDTLDPETELCIYDNHNFITKNAIEVLSFHPDVYNPFDRFSLSSNFIDSNIRVAESYIQYDPLGMSTYRRKVVDYSPKVIINI